MGGSSWQVVDAPREVVWSAFRDVRNYKRMLPAVSRATVVARRGSDTVVRIEHELGPSTPAHVACRPASTRFYSSKCSHQTSDRAL